MCGTHLDLLKRYIIFVIESLLGSVVTASWDLDTLKITMNGLTYLYQLRFQNDLKDSSSIDFDHSFLRLLYNGLENMKIDFISYTAIGIHHLVITMEDSTVYILVPTKEVKMIY